MVHCKRCNSTFDQEYVLKRIEHHCPLCDYRLDPSDMDRVTGGPDLLPDGSNYDKYAYPLAMNTVDIAICMMRDQEVKVLQIKRKFHPYKDKWALPGGFLDLQKDETLEQAALRELKEETGVTGVPVRHLGVYGDPGRDPRGRVVTTVFYALVNEEMLDVSGISAGDDAKEYRWASLKRCASLAFDHKRILADLSKELKASCLRNTAVFGLLPKKFSMTECRQVFKELLGKDIPRTNFPRDIGRVFDLEKVSVKEGAKGRPASLYKVLGLREPL